MYELPTKHTRAYSLMVCMALEQGLDVLCEKPLAFTMVVSIHGGQAKSLYATGRQSDPGAWVHVNVLLTCLNRASTS